MHLGNQKKKIKKPPQNKNRKQPANQKQLKEGKVFIWFTSIEHFSVLCFSFTCIN